MAHDLLPEGNVVESWREECWCFYLLLFCNTDSIAQLNISIAMVECPAYFDNVDAARILLSSLHRETSQSIQRMVRKTPLQGLFHNVTIAGQRQKKNLILMSGVTWRDYTGVH